uniref:G_PROTEIN_RECEP_F1_2 domain-containing protein n=1 Tax=Steinernema glaseri TaxID=37863 RepID=A0A1I8AUL7_9BILA
MSQNVTSGTTSVVDPSLLKLQGVLFIIIITLSLPLNLRILHIFVSRPVYRNLECYRIMVNIGIVQCLLAPGMFFQGVMKCLQYDAFNLATIMVKSISPLSRTEAIMELVLAMNRLKIICQLRYPSFVHTYDPFNLAAIMVKSISPLSRTEAIMELVLAMNRLKIMCQLRYPSFLHTILLIVAWIFLITATASYFVFEQWYTVTASPDKIFPYYDQSKPLTPVIRRTSTYILVVTGSLTVIVYAVIISYVCYVRHKTRQSYTSYKDKHVLVYAGVRFIIDTISALCLLYRPFSDDPLWEFFISFLYPTNYLTLPPLLYLSMHSKVRQEFFAWKKSLVPVSVSRIK